jgi:hypothetical protein
MGVSPYVLAGIDPLEGTGNAPDAMGIGEDPAKPLEYDAGNLSVDDRIAALKAHMEQRISEVAALPLQIADTLRTIGAALSEQPAPPSREPRAHKPKQRLG